LPATGCAFPTPLFNDPISVASCAGFMPWNSPPPPSAAATMMSPLVCHQHDSWPRSGPFLTIKKANMGTIEEIRVSAQLPDVSHGPDVTLGLREKARVHQARLGYVDRPCDQARLFHPRREGLPGSRGHLTEARRVGQQRGRAI